MFNLNNRDLDFKLHMSLTFFFIITRMLCVNIASRILDVPLLRQISTGTYDFWYECFCNRC